MGILDEQKKANKLSEANLKLQNAQAAELRAQTSMIQADQNRKEQQRQMKNLVFDMKQSVERLVNGNYNGTILYIAGTFLNQKFDSLGFDARDLEDFQDKEYYSKTKTILLGKLDSIPAKEKEAGFQYINEVNQLNSVIGKVQYISDNIQKKAKRPWWLYLTILAYEPFWSIINQKGIRNFNSELKIIDPKITDSKTFKGLIAEATKVLAAKNNDLDKFMNNNHPEVRMLASI